MYKILIFNQIITHIFACYLLMIVHWKKIIWIKYDSKAYDYMLSSQMWQIKLKAVQ